MNNTFLFVEKKENMKWLFWVNLETIICTKIQLIFQRQVWIWKYLKEKKLYAFWKKKKKKKII